MKNFQLNVTGLEPLEEGEAKSVNREVSPVIMGLVVGLIVFFCK